MPDRVKEKLVELFFNANQMIHLPYAMNTEQATRYIFEQMADHLIANGVTFANDNNVGKFLPAGTKMFIEACERELANNGTGREMRFVGGDSPVIANGVTVQQWIPVSERLPKDNERVLVYHDDGMIRFGINKGGFADVVSSLYLQHNHRTCISKVTHWMPLPEPPKGK